MTATRPSTALMTTFLAVAAVIVLVAASPLFHVAGRILS
jgi:hypothetical protein